MEYLFIQRQGDKEQIMNLLFEYKQLSKEELISIHNRAAEIGIDFKNSIDEIENLPNTEIIIGSPACEIFSSSNKSSSADKSLGVELTETFLRIVAVKKHQPNSVIKAWFLENVVNSKRNYRNIYF
jgi:site-specific DNA-cytosine methylase